MTVRKRGVDIVEASGERKYGEKNLFGNNHIGVGTSGWQTWSYDDIIDVEAYGI